MFKDFENDILNESILDDISAEDNIGHSVEKLAHSDDEIKTQEQLEKNFQYVWQLRISIYNYAEIQKDLLIVRNMLEHLREFLNNQRVVENYALIKPILMRWPNENFDDGSEFREYYDYIITDQETIFCQMPAKNARAYRFYVLFGLDFRQLNGKRLIRFVYQLSQIVKQYFKMKMCSICVWRTKLCPYNVCGETEGGQLEGIQTSSRFIKDIYNLRSESTKDIELFKETDFQPFRRFLCFIDPTLQYDIQKELANTMSNYDSHIRNLMGMTQCSFLKHIGYSPRMKSKKIPRNAAMKRAFSTFSINGRTFTYCLDVMFGCKTVSDRSVNDMTELVSLLDNPFGNKKTGKINAEVIKKYFRENPVTFGDNYDFRYISEE